MGKRCLLKKEQRTDCCGPPLFNKARDMQGCPFGTVWPRIVCRAPTSRFLAMAMDSLDSTCSLDDALFHF